ncbi:endogenous retrovirus group K member 7 Pro protein-like [Cynocephalus volans]|uniref:endogenous retrovirus group K member 7 Pro protein-like n=1 Tax=Cynocephalus volans TaxID=110931 RepID=UPI002FCAE2DC
MSHMGIQPVPVQPIDPLPTGTMGLILGRGSLTLKGLAVHPGVVDNDHSEVQVLCSCPEGVFSISEGDRIAQLVLLPDDTPPRIDRGKMGSSGTDSAYLVLSLKDRPKLKLKVNGKEFEGILDTGADKSIVSSFWWPRSWPTTASSHTLQGLGYRSSPIISSTALSWETPEGQKGRFTPYVLPLPVNLWGRDVLQNMGFVLSNEYSPQAQQMMQNMGYKQGGGLGRREQGRIEPISPSGNPGRQGLGFS